MKTTSYKAKQFLFLIAKILIVALALWFIYDRLSASQWMDYEQLKALASGPKFYLTLIIVLVLAFVNRFFEILKWQNLAQLLAKTTIFQATRQVLSALVFSIFTPNGIGEYGAKMIFFKKEQAKEVFFLNLVCNGVQMILTILFGALGLLLLGYYLWFGLVLLILFVGWILVFVLKRVAVKGYSIERLIEKIKAIPTIIHRKNTLLGIGRYIAFTLQQMVLFWFLGVEIDLLSMLATIMSVYFLASCLPNFQFFDFMVKGGVSVFFFGLLGVNQWAVMVVSMLMWMLNVVLPVLGGVVFVLLYKTKLTKVEVIG